MGEIDGGATTKPQLPGRSMGGSDHGPMCRRSPVCRRVEALAPHVSRHPTETRRTKSAVGPRALAVDTASYDRPDDGAPRSVALGPFRRTSVLIGALGS